MKIRELLKFESWNKGPLWRIAGALVFGLCLSGNDILSALERHWLSYRESSAANVALQKVDMLQDFGSSSSVDFSSREKDAERCVKFAEHTAWTTHDRYVANELRVYHDVTVLEQGRFSMRNRVQDKSDENVDQSEMRLIAMVRSALHKELDSQSQKN